jgi:hypothetical protein
MMQPKPTPWREPFLIRTNGGPTPGQRIVYDGDDGYTWPLPLWLQVRINPDTVVDGATLTHWATLGHYVKTNESTLDAQTAESHVVRGAEYEWRLHDDN